MVLSVIDPNMRINFVLHDYKGDIMLDKIKKCLKKKSKGNPIEFPHLKDIVIISVRISPNLKMLKKLKLKIKCCKFITLVIGC